MKPFTTDLVEEGWVSWLRSQPRALIWIPSAWIAEEKRWNEEARPVDGREQRDGGERTGAGLVPEGTQPRQPGLGWKVRSHLITTRPFEVQQETPGFELHLPSCHKCCMQPCMESFRNTFAIATKDSDAARPSVPNSSVNPQTRPSSSFDGFYFIW